jgi:hypothetical protein
MKSITKLKKSILRSETAYKKYLAGKEYYKALRIQKANKMVYKYLVKIYSKETTINDALFLSYIYHLEDWFEQFEDLRLKENPSLEDLFVFTRFKDSPEFPTTFLNELK